MTIIIFYPRINKIFRHGGSSFSCLLGLLDRGNVSIVFKEVQYGLYILRTLEYLTVAHCGSAIELFKSLIMYHLEDAVCVLEHSIFRQHIEHRLCMVQIISVETYSVLHGLFIHYERVGFIKKIMTAIYTCSAKQPRNTQYISGKFAAPVSNLGIFPDKLWFEFLRKCF